MSKITYKDAGVDIEKGEALVEKIKARVKRTYGPRVLEGVGGFACLYQMPGERILAAGTDGVGTKVMLAQKLGVHHTIGIDLVAMCVNDILCTGAKPLFFMDYLATGKLEVDVADQIIAGVVTGCEESDCALIGGETAEMPGLYDDGEYDLAGFSVGEVDNNKLLDGAKVAEGDTIVAIESTGVHSNGYGLLRKLISYDEKELMELALRPTRIYVKPLIDYIADIGNEVHGLAHITGGGLLNIARVNEGFDYHVDELPPVSERPEIFSVLQERSGLSDEEIHTTFNMGMGMCVLTSKPEKLMTHLKEQGLKSWAVGKVKAGNGKVLLRGSELSAS
jgi:phosphoribosylformylglycinamidine cyclo-ligase